MRYRSQKVSSLGKWSPQLPTRFFVPGSTQEYDTRCVELPLPGCHGLWRRIPNAFESLTSKSRGPPGRATKSYPPTPTRQRLPPWHRMGLGTTPVRSPLLRGYCLFLWLHEMFQLARCPPANKCRYPQKWVGCPIRRSWDQCVQAAPPRLS